MLKTKIDQAGFDALSDTEKVHYTADATGNYLLGTDEAGMLKQSLKTERGRADTYEKWLKELLPDMPADRAEWLEYVNEQKLELAERRTINIDEWKAFKEVDPADPKKSKADIDAEKMQLSQQVRDLTRDRDAAQRDLAKVKDRAEKLSVLNLQLERTTALNAALDSVKITDPYDREVVTALLEKRGLEAQDVAGQGRVFFAKSSEGHDLPLTEALKDFVGSDQGKRFVKAPESSGAGDGPVVPRDIPVAKTAFEKMSPSQQLAAALSPAGVRDMPVAATPPQ